MLLEVDGTQIGPLMNFLKNINRDLTFVMSHFAFTVLGFWGRSEETVGDTSLVNLTIMLPWGVWVLPWSSCESKLCETELASMYSLTLSSRFSNLFQQYLVDASNVWV